jgi:hypothetical protein
MSCDAMTCPRIVDTEHPGGRDLTFETPQARK